MQALTHAAFGEPTDVIRLEEVPTPTPGEGEVLVRVMRSPIHNHDLATIRGTYGYKPKLPAIAGTEIAGVVEQAGAGVSHPVGARVAVALRNGAWAQYAIAHAAGSIPIPDAISDDVASQLLAMPLSAVVLFDELHTKPGMWIAQNAAGGAVGRILMALAQHAGVNIVNLVRRESAAEDLRSHGAQHVVVTETDGWQARVRDLTGGAGLARIVDSVAGHATLDLQSLLAPHGEIVIFGGLSGSAIKLNASLMISLECIVRGFWMSSWMQRASTEQKVGAIQKVFAMALSGTLPLPVQAVYPLSKASEALAAAEAPGRTGKILFST